MTRKILKQVAEAPSVILGKTIDTSYNVAKYISRHKDVKRAKEYWHNLGPLWYYYLFPSRRPIWIPVPLACPFNFPANVDSARNVCQNWYGNRKRFGCKY
jgi:hypothetical protein